MATKTTTSTSKPQQQQQQHHVKSAQRTLGSLLKYFEEMPLRVELKNGRIYSGTLSSAETTMALTLRDAVQDTPSRRPRMRQQQQQQPSRRYDYSSEGRRGATNYPSSSTSTSGIASTNTADTHDEAAAEEQHATATVLPLLQIRGSTIRYIHFPDQVDLAAVIQAGIHREKEAANKYKRGVRKTAPPPPAPTSSSTSF